MKRLILFIIASIFLASVCYSAPYLVCDPQAGVTTYKFQNSPAWVPATFSAQGDGSIRMDVAAAAVGTTSIEIAACRDDAIWGELCSPFVPFSFTRPSAAANPAGWKLQKN